MNKHFTFNHYIRIMLNTLFQVQSWPLLWDLTSLLWRKGKVGTLFKMHILVYQLAYSIKNFIFGDNQQRCLKTARSNKIYYLLLKSHLSVTAAKESGGEWPVSQPSENQPIRNVICLSIILRIWYDISLTVFRGGVFVRGQDLKLTKTFKCATDFGAYFTPKYNKIKKSNKNICRKLLFHSIIYF